MPYSRAAFGFRAHSGWTAVVGLCGPPELPALLHRGRIELAEGGGTFQPYHAARQMDLDAASVFLSRCGREARDRAESALRSIVSGLPQHDLGGACVLITSGRPLPELETILASHALLHAAEGVFFRQALIDAGALLGWSVSTIAEKKLFEDATNVLRMPASRIERHLAEMGRSAGPPWRQDEKLAALAAWRCLA